MTLDQIFQPLKNAILSVEYTDLDLLQLIGGWASSDAPHVATSICQHARDYMMEHAQEEFTYSALIAEVYWRVFFDPQASNKYGENPMAGADLDTLKKFADGLAETLMMDVAQDSHGSVHAAPAAHH